MNDVPATTPSPASLKAASARLPGYEPQNSFVAQYDELRDELRQLWLAPVRDMRAIDRVMTQLDDAHAAFKAQHTTNDHQRY